MDQAAPRRRHLLLPEEAQFAHGHRLRLQHPALADGKGGRYKGYAEGYVAERERVHAAHKYFDEFDVADTGAKVENTHPTECVVVGHLFDNSAQDLGYNCMAYAEFFVKRG